MQFLMKLLKELNSANSEKFMVWSILLGVISGFLPTFNIITLTILFIVFIMRIPLGLYFASWSIFSIVGYFMDFIFHKTGLVVLESNILNSFWTTLYNTPLLRWSGFNNSITMGALIWGIGLSIIGYFILSKSIIKYRNIAFNFFESKKYLNWLLPKEEKKGIFRISGLIIFITITAIITSFFMLFTDPIIKTVLEFSLSKTLRKDISIQKVDTSFSKLSLNIYKTKIGNFQIDDIYLKLSWKYLIWKKFNITDLIIKNMHTNKSIKTFIPTNHKKITSNKTNSKFKLNFKIPDASTLLANYQLETISKIEKLKNDYTNLQNLIISINKDLTTQNQTINNIKIQISQLEKQVKNIKTANDIEKIIQAVNNIKQNIDSLKTSLSKYKTQLNKQKTIITQDLKEIKIASKHDYTKLSKQYNMIQNKEYLQFTQTLLKPEISKYIDKALIVYNKIKPYMHSEPKKEYIRGKGINVRFTDKILYPNFVLRLAKISGKFSDANFKIDIHNITDNQKLLNKSTMINIISSSKYYKGLNIFSSYFINNFKLNFKLDNLKINTFNQNNITLNKPVINIASNTIIKSNIINSNSNILINTQKITYNNSKMISEALSNDKKIKINTIISGKIENFNIKINSNLDKLVSSALNKIINKEISKQKSKLKTLLNQKISTQMKENGINLDIINNTNSKINTQTKLLNNLKSSVDKYSKKYLSKKLLKGSFRKFF